MNILCLQFDGDLLNIALAQIAGHHRALGDRVEVRRIATAEELQPRLGDPTWHTVYGSLIFEWTRPLAAIAQRIYPGIRLGGTGWDFEAGVQVRNTELPAAAIGAPLDYSGWPDVDYSIGFTQRGCRRRCDFCVVPRKEGGMRPVATLREIWRGEPHARRVILLDNDFFGNPFWRDVIDEALKYKLAIAVVQGINARTLTDEQAQAIASVRWMASDFSRRRVYTAWDLADDERVFFRGMGRLVKAGVSADSIMVYMLIGYARGETHADREYRRAKLRAFGARPYPMAYVREGDLGDELRMFRGWVLQRADLHSTWDEWRAAHGDQRKLAVSRRRVSLPLFPDGTA